MSLGKRNSILNIFDSDNSGKGNSFSLHISNNSPDANAYIYRLPFSFFGVLLLIFFVLHNNISILATIFFVLAIYVLIMFCVYAFLDISSSKPEDLLSDYIQKSKIIPVSYNFENDATKINEWNSSKIITADHIKRLYDIVNLVSLKKGGLMPTIYICNEKSLNASYFNNNGISVILLSIACLKLPYGELYSIINFTKAANLADFSSNLRASIRLYSAIMKPCTFIKGYFLLFLLFPYYLYGHFVASRTRKCLETTYHSTDISTVVNMETEDLLKLLNRASSKAKTFKNLPIELQTNLLFFTGDKLLFTPTNTKRIQLIEEEIEFENPQKKQTTREILAEQFFAKFSYYDEETLESFINERISEKQNLGETIIEGENKPVIRLHSINDFRIGEDTHKDPNLNIEEYRDINLRHHDINKINDNKQLNNENQILSSKTSSNAKIGYESIVIDFVEDNSEILDKITCISDIYKILDDNGENFFMRIYKSLPYGLIDEISRPNNCEDSIRAILNITNNNEQPIFKNCLLKREWFIPIVTSFTNCIKSWDDATTNNALSLLQNDVNKKATATQCILIALVKIIRCLYPMPNNIDINHYHSSIKNILNWVIKQGVINQDIINKILDNPKLKNLKITLEDLNSEISIEDFIRSIAILKTSNANDKNTLMELIENIITLDKVITVHEVNIYHVIKLLLEC